MKIVVDLLSSLGPSAYYYLSGAAALPTLSSVQHFPDFDHLGALPVIVFIGSWVVLMSEIDGVDVLRAYLYLGSFLTDYLLNSISKL